MTYPNVERRDEGPRMTQQQAEDSHYSQLEADRAEAYQLAINEACHAIRMIPMDAVTPAVIGQLLSTIASAATVAKLDDIAESLDILSDEVTP